MRAPLIMALSVVGIVAGTVAAAAADLQLSPGYMGLGEPAAPVVIYSYEPGVTMRAYWLPPWRNRHYFPHSNDRPRLGRRENLSAPRRFVRPAATFMRSWSNAADFPRPLIVVPERRLPERYRQFSPGPATPNS